MIRNIALGLAALALAACDPPATPAGFTTVPVDPFLGQPVLGDPAAPVTLVEYASTTCSHCKAFHDQLMPELKAKYIDTGKVKLAWVVMPTAPTPISLAGAAIARCAGEARFFDVLDVLFDKQDALLAAARDPGKVQAELNAIGAQFSLSPDQVGSCIDHKGILEVTQQGVDQAPLDITGTPSFAINGQKLPIEKLADLPAALDAELAKLAAP